MEQRKCWCWALREGGERGEGELGETCTSSALLEQAPTTTSLSTIFEAESALLSPFLLISEMDEEPIRLNRTMLKKTRNTLLLI